MTDPVVISDCDVLVRPGDLRPGAGLLVADGRVAAVGAVQPPPGATVLDGRGLLAIPGLVNAHTHSPENCLRGAGQRLALEPWLLLMFDVGGLYDEHAHRVCALAGAAEMLRTGTTAVLDHLWMTPPRAAAIDATMEAYRDAGIRAAVAPLMSDHDTTAALGAAVGVDVSAAAVPVLPAAELLGCLDDAIRRWHGREDGRLQLFAGPGGVQWSSDELLAGAAGLARRHGTGFHIHLLETTVQDAICRRRFGRSGLQGLDELGVLGPNVSLPHSVWIDEDDIATIAARGAVVVHNPAANTRLGSGRAPVPELLAAGATVALGADGSASSDNQVMWDEVKLAALIHNDGDADRWIDGAQALSMGTTGGAAALGHRDDGLGTLAPGAPADLALLDRRGAGLAGALDLEGTLALSEDGRSVRHVFVAGRQVVRDGRCLTIDEDAVLGELTELAAARVARHRDPPPRLRTAMDQMRVLRAALPRHSTRT
ncbi:amidohydrolase family protein [Conexibacter woesei]|uniref:Amidohydrolase n=1 Tax=Conexibacter woesei (strain DSM 14684 / CCUG 47730 / CIP 108061 / JCM 11494 / NBRC 100937 / ID131577) TaxID=469383 RepID=D3F6V8_CONWI|nr:amidohydrolase family protein [Conexibacter woesei]ADB52756.1 amidohydrolase [Conexibacter woesei DSM 14684]